MRLTLIGLRGTGKSTVGRLVADRLGWTFVDADKELERRERRTIADIFECDGESTFRQIEEALLEELLQSGDHAVIASGGGAILSEQTRARMKSSGPVVWLTAPVETLAKRVTTDAQSASQRPSLTGKSIADEIAQVLAARRRLYQEVATITVPTQDQTPAQLADQIVERLGRELSGQGGQQA